MSYFPEDIPFMSKEELRENGIKIPKDETDINVGDTISRQAALDAICKSANDLQDVLIPVYYRDLIKTLPPVQPEPSIPLSWIDEHIELLKSLDNEFAKLAAAHISVMVQKWRREQNETDCLRGEV